jgi:hypothetical protein
MQDTYYMKVKLVNFLGFVEGVESEGFEFPVDNKPIENSNSVFLDQYKPSV